MKIVFLFGGKKGGAEAEALSENYRGRITRNFPADIKHVSSSKKGEGVKREESEKIFSEIETSDYVLLCDEHGKQMTSPEYSEVVGRMVSSGKKRLLVIVGGAYGVSEEVQKRADLIIGLSRMVFPHEIARIMILEQTYRALSILAGSQYHHA